MKRRLWLGARSDFPIIIYGKNVPLSKTPEWPSGLDRGDACAVERAADPLHGRRVNPELSRRSYARLSCCWRAVSLRGTAKPHPTVACTHRINSRSNLKSCPLEAGR